ncbi:unnamed protein product [Brassica rapa]|uniref:Uncharacterized protein n=1 Tax=Brassica campestris TaxID=3711 RepID=A0A3P5Y1R4_BRACM|nr:unnamed protein product [Brassica rapa]VDC61327.1 unnamed protein product [Brassica rapa]
MEKVQLKSDVLDSIKSDGKRWSMQEDGLIFYGRFHGEVNQENSGFRITEAVQRICVGDKAWIILQKQPVSNNNPVIMPLGSRLCPFFLRELRGSYLLLWLSLFYVRKFKLCQWQNPRLLEMSLSTNLRHQG